jgi:hypothetical protein
MISLSRKSWIDTTLILFFFVILYLILGLEVNVHFPKSVLLYFGLFLLSFSLCSRLNNPKTIFVVFGVSALICTLQLPNLSVDYFRFLWDGQLLHLGANPYNLKPEDVILGSKNPTPQQLDLYRGLSDLSKENYTCYPVLNQWYYFLSSFQSLTIARQVLSMRLLIVLTEIAGFWAALKLLEKFNIPVKKISLLFLNPLFLIETIANVHFEGVMISFLFLFLHFLNQGKWKLGAFFLGLSIQIKLLPLLFLPFLLRYLNWKKTLLFTLLTLSIVIGLQLIYLNFDNYKNFMSSLDLYFHEFEFNSILLYPYLIYGKWQYNWNMTRIYAPYLAQLFFWFTLIFAFYGGLIEFKTLVKRLFIISVLYLVFTSTVHPWYWILPLALSLFHSSKSLWIMSGLTFLSYGLYYFDVKSDYRLLLMSINLGWLVYFIWEQFRKSNLIQFFLTFFSGTGSKPEPPQG